jgi:hypothetical protein
VSGGKRYGEERRRDAGPQTKASPGTHNRKARRAAKAQGVLFDAPDPEVEALRQMWEAFGRSQRNRVRPEFDETQYLDEHGYHDPWPEHIPMGECIEAALEHAPSCVRMTPEEFAAERERLADIIAFAGSEHIACDTGKLNKREIAEKADQVRALGQALGMLSVAPGGVKFCGVWLETIGEETHARVLVDAGTAKEVVGDCAP